MSNPYLLPTATFVITDKFGGPRNHHGVDTRSPAGATVRALIGGQYVSSGYDKAVHGNWVIWRGDDGFYWNHQHLLLPCTARGRIDQGAELAESGQSGLAATGPHLHTGVSTRPDLLIKTFDPMTLLDGAQTWAEFDSPGKRDDMVQVLAVRIGGTDAAPKMEFRALGITGKRCVMNAAEWAAFWAANHDQQVTPTQAGQIEEVILKVAPDPMTAAQITALAASVAAKVDVPTASENGAAARAAIVAPPQK